MSNKIDIQNAIALLHSEGYKITEPSVQPERIEVKNVRHHSYGGDLIIETGRVISEEYFPAIKQAIENVLNNTVEDKGFGGDELVRMLRDCVSSTWGNPSLTETQLLFDKFLHDRKLAKPTPQLINSFITDYVNRNVYDKKYSQSEVDAMMEDVRKELKVTEELLNDRQRVVDAIPECPTHGANCVPHALAWVDKMKDTLPLQQKTFTAPLSLSEHPKCKNEDNSFVWTDELVLEWSDHVRDIFNNPNNNYCGKYDGFDTDFKKWKQSKQPSTTVKPEWEIVSFYYQTDKKSIAYKASNGYFFSYAYAIGTEEEMLRSAWSIHSVKRLSDGEVFSVGDKCSLGVNPITGFEIAEDKVKVLTNGRGNWQFLSSLSKLPLKQETTTEPTEDDLKSPEFNAVWNAIKKWDIDRGEADLLQRRNYSGATGTDVMKILNALKSTNK